MKKIISTDKAPVAIGPYSQAVQAGNTLFISGQIPLDPDSGKIVDGDISIQTRQVLRNLEAIVRASEASLSDVVKCTVFLADMDDFTAMNEVYGSFFTKNPPARAAVEVSRLPKDVKVEIEAIVILTD